ncbi:MAG: hypothetical protein IKO07_02365 [Clostridia bacterium]|nr:hypothetical protein [Clostridia bacterium]
MKKTLCLLLAFLLLLLTGCGSSKTDVEPTEEPAATPEPTPEPTPAPSPVPKTAVEDYEYYLVSNSTLDVMFKYPSHWINQPGRSTISYIEPVDPGKTAARLAVTSKLLAERPTSRQVRTHLDDFMKLVQEQYTGYEAGELDEAVEIMDTTGFSQRYTAYDPNTNEAVTGYALVFYVRETRRVYLFHFTAPTREFTELSAVLETVRDSLSTIT